MVVHIQTLTKA